MSQWSWAALPAGTYRLPAPALVLNYWTLTSRAKPKRCGFRRIRRPSQWANVSPSRPGLVFDFRSLHSPVLVYAEDPAAVDYDAILQLTGDCYDRGRVHWAIPAYTHPELPGMTTVFEQAHQIGQIWLLTGDLPAYWHLTRANADIPFDAICPGGTWAASVPLAAHLFHDGVGTKAPQHQP